MPLVAHHPPHLQARAAGQFGQGAGVVGRTAAAGQADVDVDQDLAQPGPLGGVHGGRRVHRHRHPGPGRHQGTQTGCVEHLVGQEEILAQAGRHHPLYLPDGGAGEPGVAAAALVAGQLGAFVGLDMGSQALAGPHFGHAGQVGLQDGGVHQGCGGLQLGHVARDGRDGHGASMSGA